jgi:hypothetical protein
MVLTSSDIGTNPATVELNLTGAFKRAKSWGAVLLIDEADIFMQERDSRDLERNGLVAGKDSTSLLAKCSSKASSQAFFVLSSSSTAFYS